MPNAAFTFDNWTRSELWEFTNNGPRTNSLSDVFTPANCTAEKVTDFGAQHFQSYGWRYEKKVNKWQNQLLSDPMIYSAVYHDAVQYSYVAPANCGVSCEPQIRTAQESSNFDVTGDWFGIVHYKRTTQAVHRLVLSGMDSTKSYQLKLKVNGLLRNTNYSPNIEQEPGYPFNVTTVKLNGTNLDTNAMVTFTLPGTNTTLNITIKPNGITEKYIRWSGVSVESFTEVPH
jgi:hypothetical protein